MRYQDICGTAPDQFLDQEGTQKTGSSRNNYSFILPEFVSHSNSIIE
jgi:hypothetical protein